MPTRRAFLARAIAAGALRITAEAQSDADFAPEAHARFAAGDFRQAVSLLAAALDRHSLTTADTARLRSRLGFYQFRAGLLPDAEKTLLAALDTNLLSPIDTAIARRNLADVYTAWERKGDRPAIDGLLAKASETLAAAGGENYALTLLSMAPTADRVRQDQLIAQMQQLLGDQDSPALARVLLFKAYVNAIRGNLSEALPLFKASEDMARRTLPAGHPDLFSASFRLGNLLIDNRVFDRGGELMQEAINGKLAKLGENHYEVWNARFSLATLLYKQKCGPRSIQLWQQLIAAGNTYGKGGARTARAQSRLALIYQEDEKYPQSAKLYDEALPVLEDYYAAQPLILVGHLHNHAVLLENLKENEKAEQLLQRCLKLLGNRYTADLPRVQQLLAIVYWKMGRVADAIPLFEKGAALNDQALDRVLATTPEDEKRDFVEGLQQLTNLIRSFHAFGAPNDDAAFQLAFTNIQQRNGRVLESLLEETDLLRSKADAAALKTFEELVDIRNQRARMSMESMLQSGNPEFARRDQQLFNRQRELEQSFSQKLAALKGGQKPVTPGELAQKLPDKGAFIQFVAFRRYDPMAQHLNDRRGGNQYAAYVIYKDRPHAFHLFKDPDKIDLRSPKFREALGDPKRATEAATISHALYELLITPLEPLLLDIEHLVIAPDSKLNLVPFAALARQDGPYLIERFTISYCSSGRELLRWGADPSTGGDVVVLADPNFGPRHKNWPFFVDPLPNTLLEAKAIQALVPGAKVFTGADATKSRLTGLMSPRILHLATHGVYRDDNLPQLKSSSSRALEFTPTVVTPKATSPKEPGRPQACSNAAKVQPDVSPLLRSLLLFTGANSPSGSQDNGILTAVEASSLKLSGTEMVVVSACDSAKGMVDVGEGVYGLRRALALSGARSQVLTLWSIDDRASATLLERFYQNLKQGESRAIALRHAQQSLTGTMSPYYWAAFILSGDPGGLQL